VVHGPRPAGLLSQHLTVLGERIVIPGAGHFLHLEQPKTVADHILGFLNS
jgi:pimeloyl-ACP methyl ester carboxylesterase